MTNFFRKIGDHIVNILIWIVIALVAICAIPIVLLWLAYALAVFAGILIIGYVFYRLTK